VLVVLAVGVARVETGQAEAGDVVTIAYLLTIVSFPIRAIGWLLGEFPRSVVGYERTRSVLDATGAMPHGSAPAPTGDPAGATLVVSDLAYSYEPEQVLLRDVDFDVTPGRTVAVVGATASGKSTLTALLTRLVDPDAGSITLDGADLRDLAPGELARVVSVVPQTAFLFDDTVRGNVTLGGDFTEDQVRAALRTAQAEEFVDRLPQGLDTPLGERGTSLSGGQRQRISLARALVRRPRLLVLDDATSAVDPEVEARILASLRGGGTGTSLVVVAYRKATIALADEVVHLADGRIADRGTHAELLTRNEAYARLVNAYENHDAGDPTHGDTVEVQA
jgi:ATP-binding cassette, subfamily B, bacterial